MLFYERKDLDYDAFLPDVNVRASPTGVESSTSSGGRLENAPNGTTSNNKSDPEDKKSVCSIQWLIDRRSRYRHVVGDLVSVGKRSLTVLFLGIVRFSAD